MKNLLPLILALAACSGSLVDHDGLPVTVSGPGSDAGGPDCTARCPPPSGASPICLPDGSCSFECTSPLLKNGAAGCGTASVVAAGGDHTCAIVDGAVRCWGDNQQGQLGAVGSLASSNLPVQVEGLTSGATSIAAGRSHTCAIVSGRVYCWGANDSGQLGIPASVPSGKPVQVSGIAGLTSTSVLAAGAAFTCVTASATVYCWGANDLGQLGDRTTVSRSTPAPIAHQSSPTALSAGSAHACAIGTDGLYCWGDDSAGQIGIGQTGGIVSDPANVAVQSPAFLGGGERHSCAGTSSGSLFCWGANDTFQVDNSGVTQNRPRGVSSGVQAVAGGAGHTCAIKGGQLQCWGRNDFGQLGVGDTTNRSGAASLRAPLNVQTIAAGFAHTCAIVSGGIDCWGKNDKGQLGSGTADAFLTTAVSVAGR